MSKDYTELLKAVDLIVSQRLNNVAFDKTLVCKIINDENKSNGEYLVEYENMKMTAYALSETEEYINGQEVYVTITQGDFNLKKIIIGSVKTSELPVYMYTNPLKNLVKLNQISFTFGEEINDEIILRDYSAEGMPEIKYLAFGANFTTQLLNGQTLTSSDYIKTYGIRITGKGVLKIDNETEEDIDWVFDNTMFQGNPYNFNGKFRQEQLFNIQNYSKLKDLTIAFFNELESKIEVEISNYELYYGYATEDLTLEEDYDKIIIYEVDNKKQYPNTSDNQNPSLKIQTKRITQKSGSVVITEDFSDTEQFEWYVYYTGAQDVGNGKNWALIKEQNSKILDLSDNGKEFTLQINTEDEYAVKTKLPNNAIQKALQIMAKLKTSDTTKLTSNNLTFYRSDYDDLQEALKGSGIELSATPQSFVYYGDSQKITTSNLSGNIAANLTGAAVWKPGVDVYWRIPLKGTMFENPFTIIGDVYYWNLSFFGAAFLSQISNGEEEVYNSSKRYKCKGTYKSEDGNYAIVQVTTTDSSTPSLPFRIKSNYVAGNTNNVIKCTVEYKDIDVGDVYDSISIGFDPYGTQGTDYTVGIVFDGEPFLSVSSRGSTTTCTLKAFLKDKDSNDITKQVGKQGTPFEQTAFEWNIEQDSIRETSIQFLEKTISEDDLTTCTIKLKSFTNEILSKYNGIISLTLKNVLQTNGLEVTYKVFCPIPLHYYTTDSPLDIYNNIALPTEVKYSYDGTNPLYNKDSVVVDNFNISEIKLITDDKNKNYIWLNEVNKSILINSFAPSIFPKATLKIEVEDSDIWYQPIAFYRNQYTSSLLNAWNGGLLIDDKGNKILTQILGAGIKNEDNSFSGVLMGAVGKETNDAITGLYGYQNGALRFKFNENGDAYIGTGSDNHIDFTDGNLDIAAEKFTLDADNIYIGDQPQKIIQPDGSTKEGPIVQFGKALKLYKDGKLELGSDSDDDNFSLSVKYVGSQKISIQPDTLKGWTSSKEALITDQDKQSGINTWEDKYLYLWTRTKVATDTYNYSSLISSKTKQKVQFNNDDTATEWYDDKNNENIDKSQTIFYRKIRYIEGVEDAQDVFEGPLELPQGKEGTSPYAISLDNDFDIIVREPNGALIQETIEIGVQYLIGDDIQESFTEWPNVNVKDGDSGYEVKFKDETNYGVFTVTINDASITSGEVIVTWNNISKVFKFKIIDGTEDYNLIVSPRVVNVDELGDTGQNISIKVKNSKGEEVDYTATDTIIYISYFNDIDNKWEILKNKTIPFTKNNNKIGIRLYYKSENNETPIVFDEEWVQAVRNGPAGTSPYTISLDNDFETVVKNDRVQLKDKKIEFTYQTYYGSEIATDIYLYEYSNNGGPFTAIPTIINGVRGYTISSLDKCSLNTVYSLTITAKKDGKEVASKTFKFQIVEMDKEYKLKINPQVLNISDGNSHEIIMQVQSGTTIYKQYSEQDQIRIILENIDTTQSLYTVITDWSNPQNFDVLKYKPKLTLEWRPNDSTDWKAIDYEEITKVSNGADSTASLTSTSLVYFDAKQDSSLQIKDATIIWDNLTDAINGIIDIVIEKKQTIGFVGIATKSIYNYDEDNPKYTNYSYETYISFIKNHNTELVIDASTNTILGVDNAFISKLLGTNVIQSDNYASTSSSTTGMYINLKDGTLDSPYFKIKKENGKTVTTLSGWKVNSSMLYHPSTKDGTLLTSYGVGFLTGNAGNIPGTTSRYNPAFYAGYDITKSKNTSPQPYPSEPEGSWRHCVAVAISHDGTIRAGRTQQDTAMFAYEASNNSLIFRKINGDTVFSINENNSGGIVFNAPITGYVSDDAFTNYQTTVSTSLSQRALKSSAGGSGIVGWGINSTNFYITSNQGTVFQVTGSGLTIQGNASISGTLTAGSTINSGVYLGSSAATLEADSASVRLTTTPYSSSTNTYSTRLILGRYGDWMVQGYNSEKKFAVSMEYSEGEGSLYGTWKLNNSTTITSDVNKKNTIDTISNKYSVLFNNLRPVTYKYNDGTSDRLHTGFIAQEVKKALDIANIDSKDFAGLVIFNQGTDKEEWTLRYEEFIALNTNEIQKLKIRVSELETELAETKEKLQ